VELVKAVVPNNDNDQYIILKIKDMEKMTGNTNSLTGAFCILERGDIASPFIYNKSTETPNPMYTHYFNQPVKLNKLQIQFLRSGGDTPDFGTSDHVLVFEISKMNQPRLPQY